MILDLQSISNRNLHKLDMLTTNVSMLQHKHMHSCGYCFGLLLIAVVALLNSLPNQSILVIVIRHM